MDRSLDDLIKENPKKFNLNKRRNLKRNNVGNKAGAKGVKKAGQTKKKQNDQVVRVNNGGRITKQKNQGKNMTGYIVGRKINRAEKIVDARNKLLAKNRLKIVDARDRLAVLSKKTDLRNKLSSKKYEALGKQPGLKSKPSLGIHKLVRDVGRNPMTRTIISRTVNNDLASHSYGVGIPHYLPQYELPPPQFYNYQLQSDTHYNFKQSSAAMDREMVPPASKRIRSTDKRLGPREEAKPKSESGFKIYVSNLHPKVTQEDIVELFGDVGPLMKASLQRPGMAQVIYVHREDALRAVDVYNNRQLDGLPMHCALAATFEARIQEVKSRVPGKANISPDINTIHKALFNKAPANSQIFTVTLPKKDA